MQTARFHGKFCQFPPFPRIREPRSPVPSYPGDVVGLVRTLSSPAPVSPRGRVPVAGKARLGLFLPPLLVPRQQEPGHTYTTLTPCNTLLIRVCLLNWQGPKTQSKTACDLNRIPAPPANTTGKNALACKKNFVQHIQICLKRLRCGLGLICRVWPGLGQVRVKMLNAIRARVSIWSKANNMGAPASEPNP